MKRREIYREIIKKEKKRYKNKKRKIGIIKQLNKWSKQLKPKGIWRWAVDWFYIFFHDNDDDNVEWKSVLILYSFLFSLLLY